MKTRWALCEYEDLLAIHPQIAQIWQKIEAPDTRQTRENLRANARTLWREDGMPLACIGVEKMWKGVAVAWTMLSSESLGYPITLSRGTKKWLDWISDRDGYHRIQSSVEHGHEAARRWLLWMGFHYEGTMVGYGQNGTTHDLYAKVRTRSWRH